MKTPDTVDHGQKTRHAGPRDGSANFAMLSRIAAGFGQYSRIARHRDNTQTQLKSTIEQLAWRQLTDVVLRAGVQQGQEPAT